VTFPRSRTFSQRVFLLQFSPPSCGICTASVAPVVTQMIHYLRVLGGRTAISSLTKDSLTKSSLELTGYIYLCPLSTVTHHFPPPSLRGWPTQTIGTSHLAPPISTAVFTTPRRFSSHSRGALAS
ncbi:hypothetical protein BJY52DRAFT_1310225, partial [Lactarius psammicola]